jgi:hypothetical protein
VSKQHQHTPGPWAASIGCGSGDHWYVFRKTAEIDGARFCRIEATNRNEEARATAKANAQLIADATKLLEQLDNVTAALETCLSWFGGNMTEADCVQRTKLAIAARELIAKHHPEPPTCGTCGAECEADDAVTCPACDGGAE